MMARLRNRDESRSAASMPVELERIRVADWIDLADLDDFTPSPAATPQQVGEERFDHLAARAMARRSAARARWRAEHEGVPVPVGVLRSGY